MRLHIIMNVVETVAKTICVESNEKKGIKNFVKLVKIGEKIISKVIIILRNE